jgi:non-homologous end joining protein Ku
LRADTRREGRRMARALWKGHLKLADFACPVALHAALYGRP